MRINAARRVYNKEKKNEITVINSAGLRTCQGTESGFHCFINDAKNNNLFVRLPLNNSTRHC